jgi:hypothetical protein
VHSVPCISRRGARVSWFVHKTKVDGFPSLCLKIGSSGLVISTSKSPLRFFSLASKSSELQFIGCVTKSVEGGRRETRVEI